MKMELREAREIAAQAWCDNSTSHLDMIPELAEAFAKILVEEVGKASRASAPVTAPDYRIADRGFRWDAETRQHIPQLLIEFAPVPANEPNEPNDSKGWKDRDSLAAMLAAAPTPASIRGSEDSERFREGWTHACNALCMEIALWIERCPHCGMPAPKAPATQEDKP